MKEPRFQTIYLYEFVASAPNDICDFDENDGDICHASKEISANTELRKYQNFPWIIQDNVYDFQTYAMSSSCLSETHL